MIKPGIQQYEDENARLVEYNRSHREWYGATIEEVSLLVRMKSRRLWRLAECKTNHNDRVRFAGRSWAVTTLSPGLVEFDSSIVKDD